MEAIITIVGFLGSGKTTLLKTLTNNYIDKGWKPFVILNDYENANLDAQWFTQQIEFNQVRALSGSCICCNGINQLRDFVNKIPERTKGITFIEANGTSDACSLMSFLGVGLKNRFLPPVQISVVNVKNWQKRGEHNELESNQIQVSSLIILSHIENVKKERLNFVINDIKKFNPLAEIIEIDKIDIHLIPKLSPSKNKYNKFDHFKAHWSSCSSDLPNLPNSECIYDICNSLPKTILRVKGCTQIGKNEEYTYFERMPNGEISVRPFNGIPVTGSKILTIGPGSEPELLEKVVKINLLKHNYHN
ncbi:GTP-binding protein [Kordia sp.]|uniref:GTP-binding protein n=1 Tax=Kordia sp. TaxID=1965332 RepID=UPI003B5921DC